MNKQSERPKFIFRLSTVVIVLILTLIGMLILPTYKFAFISLVFLLAAGISLQTGIKRIQEAQIREATLPWWKHYYIMFALTWASWAGMLLISNFVYNQGSTLFTSSVLILLVLLTLSLTIYSVALSWQQFK